MGKRRGDFCVIARYNAPIGKVGIQRDAFPRYVSRLEAELYIKKEKKEKKQSYDPSLEKYLQFAIVDKYNVIHKEWH